MKILLHIRCISHSSRSSRTEPFVSYSPLTVPIGHTSVSIIGGLVEPDVVSVEQPTIRETEVFGLQLTAMLDRIFCLFRLLASDLGRVRGGSSLLKFCLFRSLRLYGR